MTEAGPTPDRPMRSGPTADRPMGSMLSRRTVIAGGAVIGVASVAGLAVATGVLSPDDGARETGTTPPSVVPPAEGIATVGAAYLAAASATEAEPATLRAALPSLTGATSGEIIDQLETIRPAVEDDFRENRVVEVDGWILAESEARAAALVHLVS